VTEPVSRELCVAGLSATTSEMVIRELAARLFARGHVTEMYEKAALAREKASPTGLPFPDVGIAIPHAEPMHVVSPALAIATLAHGVKFRQMGSPGIVLDVRIVVMPALSAKEQAAAGLSALIERLQNGDLRARLLAATTADHVAAALGA